MDPSPPGHLRSDRAGLHGRGNDPLLLRSRPTSASLHRRDHFNLRLRHRSSPRITPMTCHNDSAPQGGPYRVLTSLPYAANVVLALLARAKSAASSSVALSSTSGPAWSTMTSAFSTAATSQKERYRHL